MKDLPVLSTKVVGSAGFSLKEESIESLLSHLKVQPSHKPDLQTPECVMLFHGSHIGPYLWSTFCFVHFSNLYPF